VTAARTSAGHHPTLELHVPRAIDPPVINAETEGKKLWESEAGSTFNLKDDHGQGMVPYTEVRARWGQGNLYLLLYAGDLDLEGSIRQPDVPLRTDDSFQIVLGGSERDHVVEVSVLGTVADGVCTRANEPSLAPYDLASARCDRTWDSRAVVAVDTDGTLNKLGDNDEEWVVEMQVPLDALGLIRTGPGTRIPFAVRRCEVGRDGPRACGSWGMGTEGGELILDP
jgi:hypothetical protein